MNFSLSNLLQAYILCRRNKRKTVNATKFEIDFETKLFNLQNILQNRTYTIGRSICFAVTYPKIREIFAAEFTDRVVHHLLVKQIEQHFEKRFIFHSYACRKNKGCHVAISSLRKFIRQITKNHTKNAYYLQVDIQGFFPNIDKNILYEIIKREIKQEDLLWLAQKIIFNDPTQNYYLKGKKELIAQVPRNKTLFNAPLNKGLPIGNLTSQFFANVYLNEVDQYIKRTLKVKYYMRYVDDLVLMSDNKDELKVWREKIDSFLKDKLKLQLHQDKDKLGSIFNGVDFLGYIVKPTYVLVRKRVVSNLKTKLYFYNSQIVGGKDGDEKLIEKEELDRILAVVNSYYGHFRHANSYSLRKDIYEKHFGYLKKYFVPTEDYGYFVISSTIQTSKISASIGDGVS